jgi:hypothetical protein
MNDLTFPLGLTVRFQGSTEEEDAVAIRDEQTDHFGWAVVLLNGSTEVAKLRVGYHRWDEGHREAMEEAVAEWLRGRAEDAS